MERQPYVEWNLIVRKILGRTTENEDKEFSRWYESDPLNPVYFEKAKTWFERYYSGDEERQTPDRDAAWQEFLRHTSAVRQRRGFTRWLKYAAILFLPLCGGTLAYRFLASPEIPREISSEIQPGRMQAVLTLGDGRQIRLTDAAEQDTLASGKELVVRREKDGIAYTITTAGIREDAVAPHILRVPRGGEYRLKLADGSRVVLNSDSRLVYPGSFSGQERRVELTGEAYFEVAKDAERPFIVETTTGEIRVLGTAFNLSAYPDDDRMHTTLVEGSVAFTAPGSSASRVIVPGEQIMYDKEYGTVQVQQVDVRSFTSWQEGKFIIEAMRLEDIMKRISRWYDVEIFYQNPQAKELVFTGDLEKYSTCSEILEIIGMSTNVNFSVRDRTIIVSMK